ncbi:ATP-binding cassette domain-containing protein [Saccharibacillus deserti]|uniref:ATP-binding cassette domain-containing protein n=1 Tax=Saccharibacillus deserti TaxID=1634444 RepID=UPI0015566E17|nr:ABC transporter ATP-binding protein [Saccharibacillus deserti]
MRGLIFENKKFIGITLLLVIMSSITATIVPVLIQFFSKQTDKLDVKLFVFAITAMIVSFVIQFFLLIYRQNYASKFNTQHLSSLIKKMYQLKYDQYNKFEPTYLINRIFAAVDTLYIFLITSFESLVQASFLILVSLILSFSIHWSIATILFLLIPINLFGFRFINTRLKTKMEELQFMGAAANKDLVVTLSNVDHIKQIPQYSDLEKAIVPKIENLYKILSNTNKFAQGSSSIIDFVNQIIQNVLYISVAYCIIQGWLPISSMIMIGIIFPLFFNSLKKLTEVNINLKALETSNDFIKKDLDDHSETDGSIEIEKIEKITLRNPAFQIENFQFRLLVDSTLLKGQIVYIQGDSGSGKSSLLKLLVKFRESSGIEINEIPIHLVSNCSLRSKIAYLSQNTTILSRTIEENIGFGRDLTEREKQIVEESGILDPIFKTKQWSTLLTENGANLSGGEKQRIAIARMLIKEADVYIFDESTSSIDQVSANALFQSLIKLSTGKIMIYTSHDIVFKTYATHTIPIETVKE